MVHSWGADWPDGFGFLSQIVDSRAIGHRRQLQPVGSRSRGRCAVDKAVGTLDTTAREQIWVDVDKKVMDDAFVLPGIWVKGLFYRPPNLTNVFITDGFQMCDYLAMGTTRK